MNNYEPPTSPVDERKSSERGNGHDKLSAHENGATAFVDGGSLKAPTKPAAAIRERDHVVTAYGALPVMFVHSEGVSVCMHMRMPDGDLLIYHVAPDKELEVLNEAD